MGRPRKLPEISVEVAAQALYERRRARNCLLGFCEYMHPRWESGVHHELMCEALDRIVSGSLKKLILNAPPRHSKSEIVSRMLVPYYLSKHPDHQVILASYSDQMAADNSRDARNYIKEQRYLDLCGQQENFPGVQLDPETTAGSRWETLQGGVVIAAGIGGAITGRGAHLAVVDDPLKDRADADSARIRENVWKWFASVLETRLMPGGAIVVMQCMTGDTKILLPDGTEKDLRDIRAGDEIATYADGGISTTRVRKWKSSGLDFVFTIKTSSGIVARANGRHPFLVVRKGELQWVRLRDLKRGENILRVTGGNGGESFALPMGVKNPPGVKGCAHHTTTRPGGPPVFVRRVATPKTIATPISSIGTELLWTNTMRWLRRRAASALFAGAPPRPRTLALTGAENSALIIATTPIGFVGSSATTAISQLDMERPSAFCSQPLPIYGIAVDVIESIDRAGVEEVFDVEVEHTENFIANGLVSHNTRWHEDDLAGLLMKYQKGQWEELIMPAVMNEHTDHEQALWPERYSLEYLRNMRENYKAGGNIREWYSLYQQNPSPEEGTYCKREWYANRWEAKPKLVRTYMASDFAVTDKAQARDPDFTCHGVVGLAEDDRLYLLDWYRERATTDVTIPAAIEMYQKWQPQYWWMEAGVIRRAIEGQLERALRETGVAANIEYISAGSDKQAKGRAFQAWSRSGRFIFPAAPWANPIIENIIGFPTLRHDDDFDVCALLCLKLDEMHRPVSRIMPKKRRDPWRKIEPVSTDRWKTL